MRGNRSLDFMLICLHMTYIYMKHCFKEFELHAEEFIEKYYWSDPDGPTKPKLAEWPYGKDDICFTNSVKWAGESERVDIFIDRQCKPAFITSNVQMCLASFPVAKLEILFVLEKNSVTKEGRFLYNVAN